MTNASVVFLGDLTNPMHNSTPIVLGDVAAIPGWSGDDADEVGLVECGGGTVFLPDLELRGPGIFAGDGEVWIVVEGNTNRELSAWLDVEAAPAAVAAIAFEVEEEDTCELAVPSGVLAISLAYEAPELPSPLPDAPTKVSDTLYLVPVPSRKVSITVETASKGTGALPFKERSILPIPEDDEPILIRCRIRTKA